MVYRATNESSDLTPEQRVIEAHRIVFEMGLHHEIERMNPNEASLVTRIYNEGTDASGMGPVSIKQLWWLRDLKDKYLL